MRLRRDPLRDPRRTVFYEPLPVPQIFTIHAASLDDPSRYRPQVVTYRMRGLAWDHLDPELPAFDKMPPG